MSTDNKSSRRDLLKRVLVVLGASVLVQPNGGVSGSAFADETKKKKNEMKKVGISSGPNKATARPPAKHPKAAPAPTAVSPGREKFGNLTIKKSLNSSTPSFSNSVPGATVPARNQPSIPPPK
jgi:hypothetical protein